ncbi:uncharacterized protein BcabD6B2_31280 [Babesia caballi]|uniref:Uncharacterized protein n=1 Tax=Babesia caballi TaxID=5871 RepID=A0AAV4LV98_BABCB|nr:hypothetical protein, conserved [Babesia caballi]
MTALVALLVVQAALLFRRLDAFRVAPVQRAVAVDGGQHGQYSLEQRPVCVEAGRRYGGACDAHGSQLHPLGAYARRQSKESADVYAMENQPASEALPEEGFPRGVEEPVAADKTENDAMYILFRAFQSSMSRPEEELYGVLRDYISSLVQDGFFDVHVYRDAAGAAPLLFAVQFNSFKAYDFVRAQLHSRDSSAGPLMNTFYFHFSRYSAPPDSYTALVTSYNRRRAYNNMMRYARRAALLRPPRLSQPLYYRPQSYDRGASMQFQPPPPAMNPLYDQPPPQMQPMHVQPMMAPPQYMGPHGHGMPPSPMG